MSRKHRADAVEVLSSGDGNYNETIQAYVTAYLISDNKMSLELEYVDLDNDLEIIETRTFTLTIEEDQDE